jgi:hypothetical protein
VCGKPSSRSSLTLCSAAFQISSAAQNGTHTAQRSTAEWLAQRLRRFGMEASVQEFAVPVRFAEYEQRAQTILADPLDALKRVRVDDVVQRGTAYNVRCVLHAPKGDGTESLAISAEYGLRGLPADVADVHAQDVSPAALAATLMRFFSQQAWLAKDIVLLLYDAEHPAAASAGAVRSLFVGHTEADASGAQLQGALHIDTEALASGFDSIEVLLPAGGGMMPNLDLHNVVARVALRLAEVGDLSVGHQHDVVGALLTDAQVAQLREATGEPSAELRQLLSTMADQALSLPTGRHSEFVQNNVVALTLRATLIPGQQRNRLGRVGRRSLLDFATVIESSMRSLNNILEPLHQSFWFYLLLGPFQYVAIGDYMVSLAPIAGVPLLLLMRDTLEMALANSHSPASRRRQSKALELAVLAYVPAVLAVVVCFLSMQFGLRAPTAVLATVGALVGAFAAVVPLARAALARQTPAPSVDKEDEPDDMVDGGVLDGRAFKVFASVPPLAFVGCFSLVNFSFALCCAIVIALLYLLTPWCAYEVVKDPAATVTAADPQERAALRAAYQTRAVARRVPQLLTVLLLSPVTLVVLACEYVFGMDALSLLSLALLQLYLFKSLWFAFLVFVLAPYCVALLWLVWWQPSHAVDLSAAKHRVMLQ